MRKRSIDRFEFTVFMLVRCQLESDLRNEVCLREKEINSSKILTVTVV